MKRKSQWSFVWLGLLGFALSSCGSEPAVGPQGPQGEPGKDGVSIVSVTLTSSSENIDTYTITYSDDHTSTFKVTNGEDGEQGIQGEPGKDGHTPKITISEDGYWVIDDVKTSTLAQGPEGEQGIQGEPGKDGSSILTANGVPEDNLGKDGDSYVDLDNWNYYVKESGVWNLKGNIKGQDGSSGENGKSAYEIYCDAHPEYEGDENQWLEDLCNGDLGNKQIHTVTFNSNDGTPVETQFVLHGEKAIKPVSPTKEYYVFSDWVDENNDHWVFNGFSITSDITLNAVWKQEYDYSKIMINEVCSKSRKSFLDKYGEESDWIELYNSGSGDINLKGCGLSKTSDEPYSLLFNDYILEGDSYAVIVASGRKNKLYENEYHAPFTLSNKKEGSLYFSSPFGVSDSIDYPALKDDISFGVLGNELTMLQPSAGRNNEEVYIEKQILPAPTFSKKSGIYSDEFDLTLTSNEGYHIYYTVDSNTPTEESTLFTSPIHIYDKSSEANIISSRTDICGSHTPYVPTSPVNKCMVVRAICYDDYGNYSPVVSSSYWIGQDDFIQSGVSVMSLSTDFDNLFDSEKGIYCRGKIWDDWSTSEDYDPSMSYSSQPANYQQKGFDWERVANITYLNEKHNVKCEQLAGVRIKGSSTRGLAKKSFNINARFLYDGNSKFDYKFNDKKCEGITLRAGGNNTYFMVTDPINSMIAQNYNLDMETQDSTPTYLFLNGEFWGLYFITDKFDSKFIEEKYDIEDSIIWKAGEIEEGYQTDISYFQQARETINSDVLTESGYKAFCNKYSVSSFIDTIIYHSYIDHFDYNMFASNSSMWRSRDVDDSLAKSDGLIRFMLYDTDFSLGTHFDYTHYPNLISDFKANSSLKYLFENKQFLESLKSRAAELVPLFSSQECREMVIDYFNNIEPLIQQNNIRYYGIIGGSYLNMWNTLIEYLENRGSYYSTFIEEL